MSSLDYIADALVDDNEVGEAQPTDNIVLLWSLDKYVSEIKDPDTKKLVAEEVKYYQMAKKIVTMAPSGANAADIREIQAEFSGVDGLIRLAKILRKQAKLNRAQGILNGVVNSVGNFDVAGISANGEVVMMGQRARFSNE